MGCETVGHLQQRLTVVVTLSSVSLAASGSRRERAHLKSYTVKLFLIKFGAGKDGKLRQIFLDIFNHKPRKSKLSFKKDQCC